VTIPKTDTALPNSQYATDLELVSGKNFCFTRFSSVLEILSLRVRKGEALGIAVSGTMVLLKRTFLREDFWRLRMVGDDCLRHW
jgi:hypothetical protein